MNKLQPTARTKYDRMENPPPIRLTERDEQLLQAIYDYGGFLTVRHIYEFFFKGKDQRTMERRISKLFHNGYIEWPSLHQRRTKPIPEIVYWLGWKGILHIASMQGINLNEPKRLTNNQLKLLKSRLKDNGLLWLDEPIWIQLSHDIQTIDVRLAFERGVEELPGLRIEDWINEANFRVEKDRVELSNKRPGRIIIPDLYLLVIDAERKASGVEEHKARLLFEIDMANHATTRFAKEKLSAYSAYLGSPAFEERFHSKNGVWLIVTTGKKRMKHLLRTAKSILKEKQQHFLFSTHHLIRTSNPLSAPIWWIAGRDKPISLYKTPMADERLDEIVYQAVAK